MVNEKIGCVILAIGKKYKKMSAVAANSFKKFHPNIDLFLIDESNLNLYSSNELNLSFGFLKYAIAYEIMKKHKKDKIIILGSDTITCDYLSEFIENDEDDILATLDYPYQLCINNFCTPDSETHLNADVVCFNNSEAILDCIKKAPQHNLYFEQGALNEIVWTTNKYKTKIVDGPYKETKVLYNVRSKGNIIAAPYTKPWSQYTKLFYVKENKLYTHDNKQIKVFHYCEGFGTMKDEFFLEIINSWIFDWFNEDTKNFFKQNCDSANFFEEKYEL